MLISTKRKIFPNAIKGWVRISTLVRNNHLSFMLLIEDNVNVIIIRVNLPVETSSKETNI